MLHRILHDPAGAAGGPKSEAEFQTEVLAGLGEASEKITILESDITVTKTRQEKILSDVTRLDKGTKQALEEVTLLKKGANDTTASFATMQKKLALLDARVQQEVRSAFGNPLERLLNDEEKRTRLNAAIRQACCRGNKEQDPIYRNGVAPVIKALGEDASPGSTLIDDRLANEIYDVLATYGVWNTFGVVRVGTQTTKFPVTTTRPTCNVILTEGGTISADSAQAGSSVSCVIEVLATLILVSQQLLEDSEFDVAGLVLGQVAEAHANKLDHFCLTAAGVADATDGGMEGILTAGTVATAAAAQTTEATDFEDWTRCVLNAASGIIDRPCKWWINPQHLIRALSVKDNNGRPIFLTALEAPAAGSIGSILGYPVVRSHVMPTTNAAASKVAAFGDPRAMVLGIRRDFTWGMSDDFKFDTLQRAFRGWNRAGSIIRAATGASYLQLAA